MWTTKLSDIIGASHKYSKSFWNYSEVASEGLKLLAEEGNTTLLENELKEMIKVIKLLIMLWLVLIIFFLVG